MEQILISKIKQVRQKAKNSEIANVYFAEYTQPPNVFFTTYHMCVASNTKRGRFLRITKIKYIYVIILTKLRNYNATKSQPSEACQTA
jgi:hypothetical protein